MDDPTANISGPTGPGDTIVALSTAPGTGAIGIVRLSGPEAAAIAGRLGVPEDVIANSSPAVHDLDLDRRQQVLELLPPLAVAVSRMVEQRTRLVSTLEGIAELAGAATERRSLS